MISRATRDFFSLLKALPKTAQAQAKAAFEQFLRDPFHPSLQFKRVGRREPVYSARVGIGYRALGKRNEKDRIVWFWIGTHAEYDDEIKKY